MKINWRTISKILLYFIIALVPIVFALGVGWLVISEKNGSVTQIFWAVTILTTINSYLIVALTNSVRKNWKKSQKIHNFSEPKVIYVKNESEIESESNAKTI